MKRGDIVIVSARGDYGKPRPSVVVQSDWFDETDSVLVVLMTSVPTDSSTLRLTVEPDPTNKLKTASQIMFDKIMTVNRNKCGKVIGSLDEKAMVAFDHMLALMLGLSYRS
jgi:mRNA interferase MazF